MTEWAETAASQATVTALGCLLGLLVAWGSFEALAWVVDRKGR